MRTTVEDQQSIAEVEREACAKLAEGRAIMHKAEGRGHAGAAREALAIAAAIRDRTRWPMPVDGVE